VVAGARVMKRDVRSGPRVAKERYMKKSPTPKPTAPETKSSMQACKLGGGVSVARCRPRLMQDKTTRASKSRFRFKAKAPMRRPTAVKKKGEIDQQAKAPNAKKMPMVCGERGSKWYET
jgi:hypothetical protein